MDNITHSLVGITVGELWYFARREKLKGTKRTAIVATSLVANNLPDLDAVYASAMDVDLGYLLHHRGHTHTMAFGLLIALFPWLIAKLNWKALRPLKKYQELLWVAAAGVVIHIGLDALNSYGVHPFWPVWNRWFYLDTLFILEPLAWLSLLPAILFGVKKRVYRIVLAGCYFGILAATWAAPIVSFGAAFLCTLFGLMAWWFAQRADREVQRYISASYLFLVMVTSFGLSGRLIRWGFVDKMEREFPGRKLTDVVISPLPGDIGCWLVIGIQTDAESGTYYMRRGLASLWFADVSRCPSFRAERGLAPMQDVAESEPKRYRWAGEYRGDYRELKNLAQHHCQVKGFLSFARAPFLVDKGDEWLVGDLRFDSGGRMSFAHFLFSKHPDRCPDTTVPWTPPWHRW